MKNSKSFLAFNILVALIAIVQIAPAEAHTQKFVGKMSGRYLKSKFRATAVSSNCSTAGFSYWSPLGAIVGFPDGQVGHNVVTKELKTTLAISKDGSYVATAIVPEKLENSKCKYGLVYEFTIYMPHMINKKDRDVPIQIFVDPFTAQTNVWLKADEDFASDASSIMIVDKYSEKRRNIDGLTLQSWSDVYRTDESRRELIGSTTGGGSFILGPEQTEELNLSLIDETPAVGQ